MSHLFLYFYTSEMNTHSYMPFLFSINFLCHLCNIVCCAFLDSKAFIRNISSHRQDCHFSWCIGCIRQNDIHDTTDSYNPLCSPVTASASRTLKRSKVRHMHILPEGIHVEDCW